MPRSYALEEYLEAIYVLTTEGVPVIGARMADFLNVRAPSVTQALRRLEKSDLITQNEHHVVSLTPSGLEQAASLVRRHRLAERWLTDVLGFDWAKADTEATKLAHAFSDDVADRLSKEMRYPETCPHGNPIPGNSSAPFETGKRLDEVPIGESVVVLRVVEHAEVDLHLLQYLWGHGILPGVQLTVIDNIPGAGAIAVVLGSEEITIGLNAASKIEVRKASQKPAWVL